MTSIWIYWDPPAVVPAYFDFCMQQISRCAGFPVRIVGYDDAVGLGCWMPPRDVLPFKAHYADIARAQLIGKYGGITMDADTLVMPPFFSLYSKAAAETSAFGPSDHRGFFVCGLYSPPNTPWTEDWVEGQKKAYRDGRRDWVSFGAPLLWGLSYPKDTRRFSLSLSELMPWHQVQRLMSNEKLDSVLSPDSPFISLFNKGLSALTKNMSFADLVDSPTLLGQLMRYARSL